MYSTVGDSDRIRDGNDPTTYVTTAHYRLLFRPDLCSDDGVIIILFQTYPKHSFLGVAERTFDARASVSSTVDHRVSTTDFWIRNHRVGISDSLWDLFRSGNDVTSLRVESVGLRRRLRVADGRVSHHDHVGRSNIPERTVRSLPSGGGFPSHRWICFSHSA